MTTGPAAEPGTLPVLNLVHGRGIGGEERRARVFAEHFGEQAMGTRLASVVPAGGADDRPALPMEEILYTEGLGIGSLVRNGRALAASVTGQRVGLLNVFKRRSLLLASLVHKETGVPFVFNAANRWPGKGFTVSLLAKGKIVAISRQIASWLVERRLAAPSQIEVIPLGVDPVEPLAPQERASVRRELDLPDDALVLVNVGRASAQKNQKAFIDLVADLRSRGVAAYGVVVGGGPLLDELRGQATGAGVAPFTRFTGWTDRVPAYLGAADLFVQTSAWEGMPNAVLEAMTAGLPVVASDVGGTSECLRGGECGLLFPLGSRDGVLKAVLRLAEDGPLRAEIGSRGREVARVHHTTAVMLDRYARLFRDLLPPGGC